MPLSSRDIKGRLVIVRNLPGCIFTVALIQNCQSVIVQLPSNGSEDVTLDTSALLLVKCEVQSRVVYQGVQ
jgi:hypothetical protein